MTSPDPSAQRLFDDSRAAAAARDTGRAVALAQQAVELDPAFAEALEHLATLLVTRRRRYRVGLRYAERAVEARPDDAGLWYSLGWLREFAAHELRRESDSGPVPSELYEQAADAFRRCLALKPEGKLQGDAEDLLDHVENELSSM